MRIPHYIHEILLATGIFLAGLAVNSINKIAEETGKMRVDLAVVAQKIMEHERRIEHLERPLAP